MATITTRSGKGSPLTNTEVDDNFTNLNTAKLEVSGGTMTGNLTTPGLTVDGTVLIDGANALTLRNDTATDADEPKITFDNDLFAGANYAKVQTGNGGLLLKIESPSTSTYQNRHQLVLNAGGADDFSYNLSTDNGSTYVNYFKIDGGNVVFNETGANKDFRVESDNSSSMLFVDAENDRVGIKTTVPSAALDIVDNFSTVNTLLELNSSGGLSGGVTGPVYGLYADINSNNNANAVYGGYFQAQPGTGDPIYAVYGRAFGQGTSGRASIGVLGTAEVSTGPTNQNPLSKTTGVVGVFAEVEATGTDDNSTTSALTAYNVSTYGRTNYGAVIRSQVPADTSLTSSIPLRVYYGSDNLLDVIGSTTSAGSQVVVNQSSIASDFRVESDGASHMLYVDGTNNRVGIGQASPGNPLHVTTSSAGDILTLESTNASTGTGPSINLYRNSSTPADNDLGPAIYFRGENSAGGQHTYANIYSQFNDVTDGTEDVSVFHQISIAGIPRSVLSLKNAEVVINDESQNVDFRVESDANDHMLFVDAALSRVGIMKDSPTSALDVNGSIRSDNFHKHWTAKTSKYVWTRVCEHSGGGVYGGSYLISMKATRNNVVYRMTALVDYSHSSKCNITVLSAGDYTGYELRAVVDTNGAGYLEIKDNGSTASPEGGQDLACTAITTDYSTTITPTTTLTNGNTIPTGYVERSYINGLNRTILGNEHFAVHANRTTFNENGTNRDFYIESDVNSNSFYLEGATGKIGLNNGSPAYMLDATAGSTLPLGIRYTHTLQNVTDTNTQIGVRVNHNRYEQTGGTMDAQGVHTGFEYALNTGGSANATISGTTYGVKVTRSMGSGGNTTGNNYGYFYNSASYGSSSGTTYAYYIGNVKPSGGSGGAFGFYCADDNATHILNGTTIVNDNATGNGDFRVKTAAVNDAFFVDASANAARFGPAPSYSGANANCGVLFESIGTDAQTVLNTNKTNQNMNIAKVSGYTNGNYIVFFHNSAVMGSIGTDGSSLSFNTTSDARLKFDVNPITDGTEKLLAMKPVTHRWKATPDEAPVHGFIAQDMQEVLPEAVSHDYSEEKLLAMDYGRITPVIVAALQDAHKKIAELEARLNTLEGK
jgi:hypothetical protein